MSATSGSTCVLALLMVARTEMIAWFRFAVVPCSDARVALSAGELASAFIELAASVIETTRACKSIFSNFSRALFAGPGRLRDRSEPWESRGTVRPARAQFKRRTGMKIEIDIEQSGQQALGLQLRAHATLDQVFESGCPRAAPVAPHRREHRSIDIDYHRKPEVL